MAKKPDGKAAKTERVTFTRPAAERIAKVVREVEGGNRDTEPLVFGNRISYRQKAFRICTYTGAWSIGESKSVAFKFQTTTPNTVSAVNLFCGLTPSTAHTACDVSIAKDGTAWYLVQPNLTHLVGYSSSGTHVLGIVSGSLRWIGTTAC